MQNSPLLRPKKVKQLDFYAFWATKTLLVAEDGWNLWLWFSLITCQIPDASWRVEDYANLAYFDLRMTSRWVVLCGWQVFQLTFPEEVQPSLSTARRSQTTGHLLVTMPKVLHNVVYVFHSTSQHSMLCVCCVCVWTAAFELNVIWCR